MSWEPHGGRPPADDPGDLRGYEPIHPGTNWRNVGRALLGPLVTLAILAAKFGFVLVKFASIFVAVGGYALLWGWQWAVGFVALILIHELGHFFEGLRLGLRPSWPVFIPFLGAYVAYRDARMTPWQLFTTALAGPVLGGVGAGAFWVAGEATGSRVLQALGYTGFLLNLINLAPLWILDGGHVVRAWGLLRRGGAPGRANLAALLAIGVAAVLALGMVGAHVAQDRL